MACRFSVQACAQALGLTLPMAIGDGARPSRGIVTDSRQLQPGEIFLALRGERHDANRAAVLRDALGRGARCLVVRRGAAASLQTAVALLEVDDTLRAYQQLARAWRRQLGLPVVAVTGSAGKTTTRELIKASLAPLGAIHASVANENNDVGLPRTLLGAGAKHRAVVVEMGMRGVGEIARLSLTAEPSVAVITNIGMAHIGRLGSREAIARAKCELVQGLRRDGLVVIPAGDPLLERLLARLWRGAVQRVALADDVLDPSLPPADWIAAVDPAFASLRLRRCPALLSLGDGTTALPQLLPGVHNARNQLLALAVAAHLGVAAGGWALATGQLHLPGGRGRRLQRGGMLLLDETYNASPEAVEAALGLLVATPTRGRRFAALGTMLELGGASERLHGEIGALALRLGLDGLVVVDGEAAGAAMVRAATGLERLRQVADAEAAAAILNQWLQPGDVCLLKASRAVGLERALPLLVPMAACRSGTSTTPSAGS